MMLSVVTVIEAQNLDDALRYSQIFYGGSARFNAMGGAFSALGGDISVLNQNPAGLGVFRSSELTISPQMFDIKSTADFNGRSIYNLNNFNLGQIGIVSNLITNSSGLISFNVAYAYNKTNTFNQTTKIQGINNSSSIADYWASLGNGFTSNNLDGTERLAWETFVIDSLSGINNRYGTVYSNYGDNLPSVYGQTVTRLISNEGSVGEHSFSFGGNYENKLFFGATLGISKINYTSHYEHTESANAGLPSLFKDFSYTDHFEDKGTGYTIKIGAIYKPVDAVRIGLAFHSPTWYKIDEYYYNDMVSHFTDGATYEASNDPLRFNYALATPYRLLAGVGIQIQKIALLSADYEYVNYSNAKFSETGDNYNYGVKNAEIKNSLQSANNIRVGGEVRLSKVYLRAGYGLYGKPFNTAEDNADLNYKTISFGVGVRERNVSIDLAFSNLKYSQKYFLYPVSSGTSSLSNIGSSKNIFTLTLGYKFGI